MAVSCGAGVSPWLSGVIHDRTGSYDAALALSIVAFVLAVGAAWLLPEFRAGQVQAPSPAGAGAGGD